MGSDRRDFLKNTGLAVAAAATGLVSALSARAEFPREEAQAPQAPTRRHPIGVSTYSFWQFRGERLGIEACIDKAAAMGFDGVEILHVQMQDESNAALQKIKRRAHSLGLALMGFSTHQGFVSPDADLRRTNVQKTLYQIDLAYRLGIPTMRINTGRWGTIKSFDDFMARRGSSRPWRATPTRRLRLGHRVDRETAPHGRGVRRGARPGESLGPGRTAAGVLRIVEAIKSPWLRMTLDTGNFLERPTSRWRRWRPTGPHRAGAGEDLLRRRAVVRAGPRLRPDRRDPARPRLPRLDLAGVRGERGRRDRRTQEPGDAEEALLVNSQCGYSHR